MLLNADELFNMVRIAPQFIGKDAFRVPFEMYFIQLNDGGTT